MTPPGHAAGEDLTRRALAQGLLERAREAVDDAALLLGRGRLRSAATLAAEAVFDVARGFLILADLDAGADLAGTTALFDRQVIETGIVSEGLSLTVHRALRLSRELREGMPVGIYEARARGLLTGARQLLAEAEIVLPPEARAIAEGDEDDGEGEGEVEAV